MEIGTPIAFFKQTLQSFKTTGAVAPSSPFLAHAMVAQLPPPAKVPPDFRVLEVGPGTGAFTEALAKRLHGHGRLDLYEINADFVRHLRRRLERKKVFIHMQGRIQLHEGDVLRLPVRPQFDAIVSGLPFNNFTPDEVRSFLEHFRGLLRGGGTLSYFEYCAIRKLQAPFVSREQRLRLEGIERVVTEFARTCHARDQIVPINLPPARVRHLKFGALGS